MPEGFRKRGRFGHRQAAEADRARLHCDGGDAAQKLDIEARPGAATRSAIARRQPWRPTLKDALSPNVQGAQSRSSTSGLTRRYTPLASRSL
uniref:Uncharacterized protein n=1 Tax=Ralstonia solanacearum TaxID=305 RepID=A0A0S4WV29_RALSL|nr:protein of unknown function [Ralstonia solanacearum]